MKEQIMKADHRLKSSIYSYDLADNDYYKGMMQIEENFKRNPTYSAANADK